VNDEMKKEEAEVKTRDSTGKNEERKEIDGIRGDVDVGCRQSWSQREAGIRMRETGNKREGKGTETTHIVMAIIVAVKGEYTE
jgi:hypothetical protein